MASLCSAALATFGAALAEVAPPFVGKAVKAHGKGGVLAAHCKGGVLAAEVVEAQGKGRCLPDRPTLDAADCLPAA